MATIQIIARDENNSTIRRYRTRTYKTVVNALCRLDSLTRSGDLDSMLNGTDNLLIIVRDEHGNARHREMIR